MISAAGRFSYPTLSAKWPYGAGRLQRRIEWADGTGEQVDVSGDLKSYAKAVGKPFALVGSEDMEVQPSRPAHKGRDRIGYLESWADAMHANATRMGEAGRVRGRIVPGIAHDSRALTPMAQQALAEHLK